MEIHIFLYIYIHIYIYIYNYIYIYIYIFYHVQHIILNGSAVSFFESPVILSTISFSAKSLVASAVF